MRDVHHSVVKIALVSEIQYALMCVLLSGPCMNEGWVWCHGTVDQSTCSCSV